MAPFSPYPPQLVLPILVYTAAGNDITIKTIPSVVVAMVYLAITGQLRDNGPE